MVGVTVGAEVVFLYLCLDMPVWLLLCLCHSVLMMMMMMFCRRLVLDIIIDICGRVVLVLNAFAMCCHFAFVHVCLLFAFMLLLLRQL